MRLYIIFYIVFYIWPVGLSAGDFPSRIINRRTLGPGVRYIEYRMGSAAAKHSVHVVELDMLNPALSAGVMKAGRRNRHLAKLHDIIADYDSADGVSILAGVNANFWRAGRNYPIGPAVSQGEIIEMETYKEWSSVFFDTISRPYFDKFSLKGYLIASDDTLQIVSVNRRIDTAGAVMFNRFAGEVVPVVSESGVDDELNSILADSSFKDITESEIDTARIREEIVRSRRQNSREYSNIKIPLRYIDQPYINIPIRCIAGKPDTGAINIPAGGCIVSFGGGFPDGFAEAGDTVTLEFRTRPHRDIVFMSAVCGTPRLMRDGTAAHEADKEGITSRRFIRHHLPRTAVGADKNRTRIYLVAAAATRRRDNQRGASLSDMARIMKAVGAWDAINLDGGGSTTMVIDGKNVINPRRPGSGRKISVGLGAVLETGGLMKNIFDK